MIHALILSHFFFPWAFSLNNIFVSSTVLLISQTLSLWNYMKENFNVDRV